MNKKSVILGAGISGIKAASNLVDTREIIIIEKMGHIGGLGASFNHKGFRLDIGPHKLYSTLPGIMNEIKGILDKDCLIVKKLNKLRIQGKYYSFPIRPFEVLWQFSPILAAKCGISYCGSFFKRKEPISYEDYFLKGFGKAAYELMFKDIAIKVWGNPETLSAELAKRRIPLPSILKMFQSMITKKTKSTVSAEYFYYPKNGIGSLCDKLADGMVNKSVKIELDSNLTSINVEDEKIVSVKYKNNGKVEEVEVEDMISTIHLIDLVRYIRPMPPNEVIQAAENLKYRSLILLFLFIRKEHVMKEHWIFFPQKETIFTRVAELKNFSDSIYPKDKTVLTVEIGCDYNDQTFNLQKEELFDISIRDLENVNLLKKEDVEDYLIVKINRMYPVYDISYKKNLDAILKYLDKIKNLYSIGRQGLFNYTNMDHSIDMANKVASHILGKKSREEWIKTREYFEDYRIVD